MPTIVKIQCESIELNLTGVNGTNRDWNVLELGSNRDELAEVRLEPD